MTAPSQEQLLERLNRPDAIVFRRSDEANAHVKSYTVALRGPLDRSWCASGVLVRVGGRTFIFTAGHVVQEFRDLPVIDGLRQVQILVSNGPSSAGFPTAGSRYRYDPKLGVDYGYLEIAASDRVRFESADRIFLPERLLQVEESFDDDDFYVISGYPAVRTTFEGTTASVSHTTYTAAMAGHRKIPLSGRPAGPGIRHIDLALDPSHAILDVIETDRVTTKELEPAAGASGGGCWKANLPDRPELWTEKDMRLIGVHVASVTAPRPDTGAAYQHARETLVGHHLVLIAADYPDLRELIFAKWPLLATWPPP